LKFNFKTGARGNGGEKIRDALFSGVRVARREKGGIHAGQCDKFGQKFFRARHARGKATICKPKERRQKEIESFFKTIV
jgi:hypothetical protein